MGLIGLLWNTAVHVLMYWYYFASNLGWNVWYKKYITSIQIVQFVCNFLMSLPVFFVPQMKGYHSWSLIIFSLLINLSFFGLFLSFYFKSYKSGQQKKSKSTKIVEPEPKNPKLEKLTEHVEGAPSPTRTTPRRQAKKGISYAEIPPEQHSPVRRTPRRKA
jgi:hypothetical protein